MLLPSNTLCGSISVSHYRISPERVPRSMEGSTRIGVLIAQVSILRKECVDPGHPADKHLLHAISALRRADQALNTRTAEPSLAPPLEEPAWETDPPGPAHPAKARRAARRELRVFGKET